MKNILRPTNDPLGGFTDLLFVPDIHVNSIDNVYTNSVFIDLATDKRFYKMECVHATAEVKASAQKTALGKLYDIEINALVAGNYTDNNDAFDELLDYKFIVLLTDNNCVQKVYGNTEQPLDFSIVSSSKNEASQRKEVKVKFTGQCFVGEKIPSNNVLVYAD